MTLPGKPTVTRLPVLLWRNALRHQWRHRGQALLAVLGIALGVMMVVAVDLANASARRAFALSIEAVSGSLTHQIVGSSQGVPEHVFAGLRTELGVYRSAPALEGQIRLAGRRIGVLGLDLISEAALQRRLPGLASGSLALVQLGTAAMALPGAVLLPEALAAEMGLEVGSRFSPDGPFDGQQLSLAGTLTAQETNLDLLLADIAVAQDLLGKTGWLDSIDLILDEEQAARVRDWLPAGLRLVEAGTRHASLEQLTEAFHVNLLAMSLLALLVAALLIHNTMTLSVLERGAEFGVLRAQGVTGQQLQLLVLGEAAVVGAVASALGLMLGIWLGSNLVTLVTRTIEDLYFTLAVREYQVAPLLLLKAFSWGLGLSLLSAWWPARQAGRSLPATLQQAGQGAVVLRKRLPLLAVSGALLLLCAWLVLRQGDGLFAGFVALFMGVAGYCLLTPLALHGMLLCLHRWLPGVSSLGWYLALRATRSGLDRSALAVAALSVAVSVTIGVGVMVASLRGSVLVWLDQSLPGDIQVVALDASGLPPQTEILLAGVEGVEALSRGWQLEAESSAGRLRLHANSGAAEQWLYMKSGNLADDGIAISEAMAYLLSLRQGDVLSLYTPAGERALRVSGVFHDYSTGTPLAALSAQQMAAMWPDLLPSRLGIALAPGQDAERMASQLQQRLDAGGTSVLVTANRAIREVTLRIFDRTFAITHVLRLLAIGVAFVGVFSAMLALQLQQARDHAVLRASGMTGRGLAALILWQTLILGACAGLLALPLGLLMSDVLIDVINQRSFGWSMQHNIPPGVLLQALGLAVVAAVLSGIEPARRLARLRPAVALRAES